MSTPNLVCRSTTRWKEISMTLDALPNFYRSQPIGKIPTITRAPENPNIEDKEINTVDQCWSTTSAWISSARTSTSNSICSLFNFQEGWPRVWTAVQGGTRDLSKTGVNLTFIRRTHPRRLTHSGSFLSLRSTHCIKNWIRSSKKSRHSATFLSDSQSHSHMGNYLCFHTYILVGTEKATTIY